MAVRSAAQTRIIPCILLKNGLIVRSQTFSVHQVIGNPLSTIRRFSDWNVDELVLLDISKGHVHDLRRDDLQAQYSDNSVLSVLQAVSSVCAIPLAVGGRIHSVDDMRVRLRGGADKCVINTQAILTPQLITDSAKTFGSQCIVVSIDAKEKGNGQYEVYRSDGQVPTGLSVVEWAKEVEKLGAGEILLNSIDRDGSGQGYDIELVKMVASAVKIPVIAMGGVGQYSHFATAVNEGSADAAAAANIFHFFELSYPIAKNTAKEAGVDVRGVVLENPYVSREPRYDLTERDARIRKRLEASKTPLPKDRPHTGKTRWCTRCVYPSISAAPMEFDDKGVCTGCRIAEAKKNITKDVWERRTQRLYDILKANASKDGSRYDCIIAVSGGKDSYFQTHIVKREFGFNPLLVTYNGNNWLESGWKNMLRMREVFDVDHVMVSPSIPMLQKLNRLGFIIMGDMNWHAHMGIMTTPMQLAVKHQIPIVMYGEHGYMDLCGQFSLDDFPEVNYRDRTEHFGRGYDWNYMLGLEGIEAQHLMPYKYPSDQQILDLGLRGIHLGNYVFWEANEHGKKMVELYKFENHPEPFERTYRQMSNLDDMHENGAHDYLKYVKFGYGRCTDHACKDIRAGIISRDEGIARVRKMDHIKPKDIRERWLSYANMDEATFDAIADTYRDPRVWARQDGQWVKDNIWD